jgi:hypothetical protein
MNPKPSLKHHTTEKVHCRKTRLASENHLKKARVQKKPAFGLTARVTGGWRDETRSTKRTKSKATKKANLAV